MEAGEVADVQVAELDEIASPYVLEETPSVLNVLTSCDQTDIGSIFVSSGMCHTWFRERIGVDH